MATLEEFVRTGHLGPIILGVSPTDVMTVLGEPDDISKKANPLILKYGCVQLTFWKALKERPPQLREIVVTFDPFEPPPPFLEITDWNPEAPSTEWQFTNFMHRIGYMPVHMVEGSSGRQLLFLSGVTALFVGGMLQSLRFLERETKASAPLPLFDEREPAKEQILAMLDESQRAWNCGAYRAALLIGWAGLEAALRRTALRAGGQGKIGVQPTILLRELFSAGMLTPIEHQLLEHFRQLRTAAAHGLAPLEFDPSAILLIDDLAQKFLVNSEWQGSAVPQPAS
jgi:hypothetical protein